MHGLMVRDGASRLLTMRVLEDLILRACEGISDLILRSHAQHGVSKDEGGQAMLAAILRDGGFAASSG